MSTTHVISVVLLAIAATLSGCAVYTPGGTFSYSPGYYTPYTYAPHRSSYSHLYHSGYYDYWSPNYYGHYHH